MRAISLWQPWASLIAAGLKPFETRHWAPPRNLIGQTIAIHAAKKIDRDAAEFAEHLVFGGEGDELARKLSESWRSESGNFEEGKFGDAYLPIGCVVAIARLDAAFQLGGCAQGTAKPAASVIQRMTSRPMPPCFSVCYDKFGDYSPGRWAWLLSDVKPVNPPAPAKGAQGFFELPQGWLGTDA